MNIEEANDNLIMLKYFLQEEGDENWKKYCEAIETLLTAYEKEKRKKLEEYIKSLKEKNMELTNSYNQAIKETNEENRRCMLLAVENQDLKEKNKRLEKFIKNGEHTWKQKYNETFEYVKENYTSNDKIKAK